MWYAFDEFTNSIGDFIDSSGQGHMGTPATGAGMPTYFASPPCIYCDGTDWGNCSTNLPNFMNGCTAVTYNVWIKAIVLGNSYEGLLIERGSTMNGITGADGARVDCYKNGAYLNGPPAFTTGVWQMISYTYNHGVYWGGGNWNNLLYYYTNGVLKTSYTAGGAGTNLIVQDDNLYIGWDDFSAARRATAYFGDVMVWTNTALSATALRQMYLDRKVRYGL
jgi:hypothetical protein